MAYKNLIDRNCVICGKHFKAQPSNVRKGYGKCCSLSCGGIHKHKFSTDQTGENNPNWKGGISKNHYHYKLIEKLRFPERVSARDLAARAIRSGKIVRKPCEVCGNKTVHAHHADYTKPYEIEWLCPDDHRAYHAIGK